MKTKILSLAVIADTNKIILFSGIVKSLITVFIGNDTPTRRSMSNFEKKYHSKEWKGEVIVGAALRSRRKKL